MDVTKKVLESIQKNRNNKVYIDPGSHISPNAEMYTYGSEEEFQEIIAELEEEFDITFDGDEILEIGDMTVKAFIELVVKKIEKQKGDQDV